MIFHRARIAITIAFLIAFNFSGAACAYNSEEHKILADIGASRVSVPANVKLPPSVEFRAQNAENYIFRTKFAKNLAVGFQSNDRKEYDPTKKGVQDNYYKDRFGQLRYNVHIWIQPLSMVPPRVLFIPAQITSAPSLFSFGELVSFYGDYRRTVVASPSGACYLTEADLPTVHFKKGNILRSAYAPNPVAAPIYVRSIASGLVPPFGSWGNAWSYTAGPKEYEEAGWWGDEMMRVAAINDWHFSNAAIAWYVGLHRLALLYVDKARTDPTQWITALHYEASALHSLTDLFAFGHTVINRDRSSFKILTRSNVLDTPTIKWMNNVLAMGGATRDSEGRISLSPKLPQKVSDVPTTRENSLNWKVNLIGDWAAKKENEFHDKFNASGAVIKNLNDEQLQIYGDFKAKVSPSNTHEAIINTVKQSLQSLFDAYLQLQSGKSVDDIARPGSPYFTALKLIPVRVVSDPDKFFPNKWTLYAGYADSVSGANKLPKDWQKNAIPFIDGNTGLPK
jgi:hypothetical protein